MRNQNMGHQDMNTQPSNSSSRKHAWRAVQVQLRPSFEEILRQEARRRSSGLKAMINIGLDEVGRKRGSVPQRWPVPTPDVRKNLLGLATKLRRAGCDQGGQRSLTFQTASLEDTLQGWCILVSKRDSNREDLWESAEAETPSRVVWARLAPAEAEGLARRAGREDVPVSRLLRRGLRKGAQKRNRMGEMSAHLRRWHGRAQSLSMKALFESVSTLTDEDRSRPGSKMEEIREKLRKTGKEIERTVTDFEIG